MLKPFSGEKILSPDEMGPINSGMGEMGAETFDFSFATPKRHFLVRNRVV